MLETEIFRKRKAASREFLYACILDGCGNLYQMKRRERERNVDMVKIMRVISSFSRARDTTRRCSVMQHGNSIVNDRRGARGTSGLYIYRRGLNSSIISPAGVESVEFLISTRPMTRRAFCVLAGYNSATVQYRCDASSFSLGGRGSLCERGFY